METYSEVVRMIEDLGLRVTGLDTASGTLIVKIPPITGNPPRSPAEE
jgi:hypothetical protein